MGVHGNVWQMGNRAQSRVEDLGWRQGTIIGLGTRKGWTTGHSSENGECTV